MHHHLCITFFILGKRGFAFVLVLRQPAAAKVGIPHVVHLEEAEVLELVVTEFG